jgi:hypothetical protein
MASVVNAEANRQALRCVERHVVGRAHPPHRRGRPCDGASADPRGLPTVIETTEVEGDMIPAATAQSLRHLNPQQDVCKAPCKSEIVRVVCVFSSGS